MKYKGYTIQKDENDNYAVITPKGTLWLDRAANVKTAKKWVDCDIVACRILDTSGTYGCHGCGEDISPRVHAGVKCCPECGSTNLSNLVRKK